MKMATSWSRQESARARCPKRYFLNYLAPAGLVGGFRQLKSIRELGGALIHESLRDIVRAVADGASIFDDPNAAQRALTRFDELVDLAKALPPWSSSDHARIAEFHNGVVVDDEISHWRELIPRCVDNGRRVMTSLNLRPDAGHCSLEAEREISFLKRGREHRGIIDLLATEGRNVLVVEWKSHAITNTDLAQVRHYQEFLINAGETTHSRVHGIAVDLIREEIVRADYRPFDDLVSGRLGSRRPSIIGTTVERDPYPARPSAENCGRCQFAAICADSAVRPDRAIDWKGGAS